MKKIILLTATLCLLLVMNSCKRNYQVNYARVAVDSLQQRNDSADAADKSIEDVLGDDSFDDAFDESSEESIFEIPDIPREGAVQSGSDPRRSRQSSEN